MPLKESMKNRYELLQQIYHIVRQVLNSNDWQDLLRTENSGIC